jgi:hypothetical protein
MSGDPEDTNRAVRGLMEDFLGEFPEENEVAEVERGTPA